MTTGPDRGFEELRTARLVVRRFRPADVPIVRRVVAYWPSDELVP